MAENDEITKITEALYQHNQELAVKNKTLALLEKLYEKSIATLTPERTAKEITNIIIEDLKLEFTGIFLFDAGSDSLTTLALSKSDRLVDTLNKLNSLFLDIKITDIKNRELLKRTIYDKVGSMTDKLEDIWGGLVQPQDLEAIKKETNIKTVLFFPLLSGDEVTGVLVLGMNREYDTLNAFEKASIASFTNVIALSLNKAFLYRKLQDANESLKELIKQKESLMHLINHKVKGSFTHSKYIFAGMLDGTFGEINDEIRKRAEQGLESDDLGVKTIDLILNADNMQKGVIKYEMKTIDLKDIVLKTISEKKISAENKGLKIESEIKEDTYNIFGDAFWIKEAVNNLIENSIRYTPAGQINVHLEKKDGKIILSVKDNGIGITDDDKKNLFTEGGRGKDSVKINTDSTGYGLYSVKLIIDAHKGRVWGESEGPGKGSTFFIEIPAL